MSELLRVFVRKILIQEGKFKHILLEGDTSVKREFEYDKRQFQSTDLSRVPESFSGSQMVNSIGEPLVFYHGTRRDFENFSKNFLDSSGTSISTNYLGFYFTTSEDVARVYISKGFDTSKGVSPRGSIKSAALDVKNPYFISEKTYWKWGRGSPKEMQTLVDTMIANGYDGIVMPSVWRGRGRGSYDIVVFNSSQIHQLGMRRS